MFKLKEKNAKFYTEILAGITTFVSMAYIIVAAPALVSGGNEKLNTAVFVASCLSAFVGTMLMALVANMPVALAPSMGLTSFFAVSLMSQGGYSYPQALAIVFIGGLVFVLLSAVGCQNAISKAIPRNVKIAISAGLGFLIAFMGLRYAGIIESDSDGLFSLISFKSALSGGQPAFGVFTALVVLAGIIIIGVLYRFRVPGSILLGTLVSGAGYWWLGSLMGFVKIPNASFDMAALGDQMGVWANKSLFACFTDGFQGMLQGKSLWEGLLAVALVVVSFTMVEMFDAMGTVLGVSRRGGLLDDSGNLSSMNKTMLANSLGTTVGAMLGTPPVSAAAESGAGIAQGGKTGLSSLVTALLFAGALFAAPFLQFLAPVVAAPALIFIGILMISSLKDIELDDITELLPAALTVLLIPLTSGIETGIAFGLISHVLIKTLTFKFKDISILEIILAALFVIKFIVG